MKRAKQSITVKNDVWAEGDLIAIFNKGGGKISQAIRIIDPLLPQLTPAELKEVKRRLELEMLFDPDCSSEDRRSILSTMESCPCCQAWLGHNNPPDDDSDELSWLTTRK